MQPNRPQPARSSVDFWDVENSNAVGGNQMPQDAEFSELVGVRSSGADGKAKAIGWVFLILVLGVAGYGAYVYFVEERNPLEQVTALVDEVLGTSGATDPNLTDAVLDPPMAPKSKKPKGGASKQATSAPVETPPPADYVAGNPYWSLPNQIVGSSPPPGRNWSAEEEETWRAQLAHKYSFQRWQTVMDVRKRRLRGSDAVLWDAMQDKKFWTRMYAAVGLAELDVEVSLMALEGALGNTRSELVADFFERFVRRPNAGQAFVMRQVIRVLDEKGRLVVLNGIDRSRDELRDLYLVAATLDPASKVQRWITRRLARSPIPKERFDKLLAVVEGREGGHVGDTQGAAGDIQTKDGKPLRLATGSDVDEGLTDDVGGVRFFEEEKPDADVESDAEVFDYEYEE